MGLNIIDFFNDFFFICEKSEIEVPSRSIFSTRGDLFFKYFCLFGILTKRSPQFLYVSCSWVCNTSPKLWINRQSRTQKRLNFSFKLCAESEDGGNMFSLFHNFPTI